METIDFSVFKDYHITQDRQFRNDVEAYMLENNNNADVAIDKLLKWIDCSRIVNNQRLIQTINYSYRKYINQLIYMIINYIKEDDKYDYFIKLIDIHNKNLEFEKINPPIVYKEKKQSSNKKKPTDIESNEEKLESIKARKAANKLMKLNALTFKFK